MIVSSYFYFLSTEPHWGPKRRAGRVKDDGDDVSVSSEEPVDKKKRIECEEAVADMKEEI
jgi:hypothetical protein